jgi:hypothetical protein
LPVERTLFPEKNITHEQNSNVEQHLDEPKYFQVAINQRPWIQKDRFDVKQNEQKGDHVKVYRKGLPGVTGWLYAAFIRLIFGATMGMPADNLGRGNQHAGEASGYYKHEQKRAVVIEVIGIHFLCAVIIASERTPVNELSKYFMFLGKDMRAWSEGESGALR